MIFARTDCLVDLVIYMSVRILDVETLTEVACLQGHSDHIKCLAYSEGRLYSSSGDKTFRVWDTTTFAEVACLEGHTEGVVSVSVANDRLYSGGHIDKTIHVWDIATLTEVACLGGHSRDRYILCLAVTEGRLYHIEYDGPAPTSLHMRWV